jgi:hypothetical protein
MVKTHQVDGRKENSFVKILSGVLIGCSIHMGCVSTSTISSSPGAQGSSPTFSVDGNGEADTMAFDWATIVFLDGKQVDAQNVTATPDSTSFLNIPAGSRSIVPMHTIDKIINKDKFIGMLEASGIGLLAGAGTGALAAAIGANGNVFGIIFVVGGGAVVGAVAGGIVGLIVGHTYEYKFVHESKKP